MSPGQTELWQRIKNFALDEADAALPFSRKLAREQAWSRVFTLRAMEEYRRFLFLAMEAGHPVSPSDAVDQVWHLHLTYTRSYWDYLCGGVLGRPLHHVPSQGRAGETEKFGDWYVRTLDSYRRFFGEPPADLWPAVPAGGGRYRRVDLRRHWVFPKPRHMFWALGVGTAGVALLVAGGCRWLSEGAGGFPVLNLRGSAFLLFYWQLFPVLLVVALVLRFWLRGPGRVRAECPADPYAVAWLAGGAEQAALAAVCALADRGAVRVEGRDRIAPAGDLPSDAHPLEKAVHEEVRRGVGTLAGLTAQTEVSGAPYGAELESCGLILSQAARGRARWRPFGLAILPVPLGLIKIGVGVSRDRPVAFLVVSCVASVMLAWVLVARRVWRTRAGENVLRRLRADHASLLLAPTGVAGDGAPVTGAGIANPLPWAVGLFGVDVLSATPLSNLVPMFMPPRPGSSESVGGGCGSSCGGGDGGGGGGCGGCGGGD